MKESSRKIKVIMVGGIPVDFQSVKGGVEAVILNLLAGFSNIDDVEVTHVAFDKDCKQGRIVNFSKNVKVHFVPYQSRFPLLDYLINQKILRKIIRDAQPDIIHIQESEPHLLRFLNYPKKNIVVTQHGIMEEELKYAKGVKDKLKFLFKTFIEQFIFPRFKNVIFISNYNQRLFHSKLSHFKIIYNPVNSIYFSERPGIARKQNSIIYVGVINRRKNIKIILEAFHQLNQVGITYHLHVVGGYKEQAFESEVLKWVSQYNLMQQITFHGWLKPIEILKVYDQCDFFVLPSRQETLPMSIAEAMALGKTVIASDVGAVSEMFQHKVTGFLFKRDDLHELVEVLKGRSVTADLSRNEEIRNVAKEKFEPNEVARQTVNFYRTVIDHT